MASSSGFGLTGPRAVDITGTPEARGSVHQVGLPPRWASLPGEAPG